MPEGTINAERNRHVEIHVPQEEHINNVNVQDDIQIQAPVQNLSTRINAVENVPGRIHAVKFIPGNQTLTREYLGQLRADLLDQQRISKKSNTKSRLYKKNRNFVAINNASTQVETNSQQRIQPISERYAGFDEETVKCLTYFNVHQEGINGILDDLTVFLFDVDLANLHLEDDEAIAKSAAQLETLSCQVKAYQKLLEKNPEYLEQLQRGVREKIEKKLTQLNTVALYYDAKKSVMTDQYFLDHYNEELKMDVKANSPKAQRDLAQKLVDTYILGRRLLRLNGVNSLDILRYGGIVQNKEYLRKLVSDAKKKYCADEKNGSFIIENLSNAFANLNASGSIWGNSNEMKQVKAEVTAVRNLLNGYTRGKLFEDLKVSALDALGRLSRACSMYIDKKVKDIRTDTSNRHLSVLNILEAAKMGMQYFKPLTEESFRSHNPEGEGRTLADVMRDSKEQIVHNDEEEEKTQRQLERNRHYEVSSYLAKLNRDGSSFAHFSDHRSLVQKLKNKVPRKLDDFHDEKYMIEKGYQDLINDCNKYLLKKHDFDRSTMVRELKETFTTELARIKKLDIYEIHKQHGDKTWENCIIGGSVYVSMENANSYVCDDERDSVNVSVRDADKKNYSFIKAAKALGFESGIFKDYQEAFVPNADGFLQKGVVSSKENQINRKWVSFGDLINIAQDEKSNIVYSEDALRQLSSIQILDELLGIRNRKVQSLRYLGKMNIVLGEPTLTIESVRVNEALSIPNKAELKDGEKNSVYDADGKFRLPGYDRILADKIMETDSETFLNSLERGGVQLTDEQKAGFRARFNKLKTAFLQDKDDENGWRKWQEKREKKAATKIAGTVAKKLQGYYDIARSASGYDENIIKENKEPIEKAKRQIYHITNHNEFALNNQFRKSYKCAIRDKEYTGYARKEILTENLGEEKAFEDLTQQDIGKTAYKKYIGRLEKLEKKKKAINDFMEKYKPDSEKKRLQKKKQLSDDITADLKTAGLSEDFYTALKSFKEYSELDITGQDALELKEGEAGGGNDYKVRSTEVKPHEEAVALTNAIKLMRDRLNAIPEDTKDERALKEKEILGKYIGRADEITNGRLKDPQDKDTIREVKVMDDNFIDVEGSAPENWEKTSKKYVWKQVDEPLFSHDPTVNDVVQGRLGDCYLLAALGALVDKNPEFIRNMMRENKNDNTVTVRFMDGKKPLYVTVSKSVPAVSDTKKRSNFARGALWVQMIEKAFTASGLINKVKEYNDRDGSDERFLYDAIKEGNKVSYACISSGVGDKFMKVLTGDGGDSVNFETKRAENEQQFGVERFIYGRPENDFIARVKRNDPKVILTVGTRDDFELKEEEGLNGEKMMRGIAAQHAYTVLGHELVDGEDMLILRNPWGNGTVQAELNKVTGAISIRKAKAQYYKGAFLIPFSTFFYLFDHYSVMHVDSLAREEKNRKAALATA